MNILFLNHKIKECGVYQYGVRLYDILKKSTNNTYIYNEVENYVEYINIIEYLKPNIIIYNYQHFTMDWLNNKNIIKNIINIGITHESSKKHMSYFNYILSIDPNEIERDNIFNIPRPILENTDNLHMTYDIKNLNIKNFIEYNEGKEVPIFGSFGFGFYNKGFDKIIQIINDNYDNAIIKLLMTLAYYDDNRDYNSKVINEICNSINKKPGIKLIICNDFLTTEELLLFLSSNTANIFLYDKMDGRGVSSCIDYALSVNKPFVISDSYMFRHIYCDEICVYKTNIKLAIENSKKLLSYFKNKNSNNNLIEKVDNILNKVKLHNNKVIKGIFYNSKKSLCSIYESGLMVYNCLKQSEIFELIYTEEREFLSNFDFAIVNEHFTVNNWVTEEMVNNFVGPVFCVVTEVSFSENCVEFSPNFYTGYIVLDSSINEKKNIYSFPRPLEDYYKITDKEYDENTIPIIGSFGFATEGKNWNKIVEETEKYFDKAIIRFNIPYATHISDNQDRINAVINSCNSIKKKQNVKLEISNHDFTKEELIEWCSENTINCFLYERDHIYSAGLCATTDQAIVSGRPLLISGDKTFRHLHKHLDYYPNISIKDAIETTKDKVDIIKKEWSSKNFLNKFNEILNYYFDVDTFLNLYFNKNLISVYYYKENNYESANVTKRIKSLFEEYKLGISKGFKIVNAIFSDTCPGEVKTLFINLKINNEQVVLKYREEENVYWRTILNSLSQFYKFKYIKNINTDNLIDYHDQKDNIILFLNFKEKECGIYEYGLRLFNILRKSNRNKYLYKEVSNFGEYIDIINELNPYIIIYNYNGNKMNWLTSSSITKKSINIGILNNFIKVRFIFDIILNHNLNENENENENEINRTVYIPRPIIENVEEIKDGYDFYNVDLKEFIDYNEGKERPIFGSFAYNFNNKCFEKMVEIIYYNYDNAIVKIAFTGIHRNHELDKEGIGDIELIIDKCNRVNKKPGIKIMFLNKFLTNEELILFLNSNTANIFLNDNSEEKLSGRINYALSGNKPFVISNSNSFSDVYLQEICIDKTNIKYAIENSKKMLSYLKNKNSNNNLIKKMDEIISSANRYKKTSNKIYGIFYNCSKKTHIETNEIGIKIYNSLKKSDIFDLSYSEETDFINEYNFVIVNNIYQLNDWITEDIINKLNGPAFSIQKESPILNKIYSEYLVLDNNIDEKNNIYAFSFENEWLKANFLNKFETILEKYNQTFNSIIFEFEKFFHSCYYHNENYGSNSEVSDIFLNFYNQFKIGGIPYFYLTNNIFIDRCIGKNKFLYINLEINGKKLELKFQEHRFVYWKKIINKLKENYIENYNNNGVQKIKENLYQNIYNIEVSLGEIIDKYSILDLKLKYISDEKKLIEIKKDINNLKKYTEFINNSHFYNMLLYINEQIWLDTDNVKKIDLNNKEYNNIRLYAELTNKIFINNQKRYRLKNCFNILYKSNINECKSYSDSKIFIKLSNDNDIYNKIAEINYLLISYDIIYFEDRYRKIISKLFKNPNINYLYENNISDINIKNQVIDLEYYSIGNELKSIFEFDPIKYKSSGKFGDFLNQLSVINEKFYNTGQKGELYIYDSNDSPYQSFPLGIEFTYNDTYKTIMSQRYIKDYKIYNNEEIDIDLSSWRIHQWAFLFRDYYCWYNIFKHSYLIDWGKHKWLNADFEPKWNDKIIINLTNNREKMNIGKNSKNKILTIINKNKPNCLFISDDKIHYDYFCEITGIKIDFYIPKNFEETLTIINSCKVGYFGFSSMAVIANALHKPHYLFGDNTSDFTVNNMKGIIPHVLDIYI